jgi:hypothetical protein
MSPSLPFGQFLRRFAFLRFRFCYWSLGGLGGLAVKGSFHFVTTCKEQSGRPDERALLEYYANAIAPLVARAEVA